MYIPDIMVVAVAGVVGGGCCAHYCWFHVVDVVVLDVLLQWRR